jgi:hypothetical protein
VPAIELQVAGSGKRPLDMLHEGDRHTFSEALDQVVLTLRLTGAPRQPAGIAPKNAAAAAFTMRRCVKNRPRPLSLSTRFSA